MSSWNDDVMKSIDSIKSWLDFYKSERSQLYGTIAHLMLQFEAKEMQMPSIAKMIEYGETLYVLFEKGDDGKFYVRLKEQNVKTWDETDDAPESSDSDGDDDAGEDTEDN